MTEMTRRAVFGGLSAFAAMPVLAETAWPTRPITMTIGFPASGPTDVVSRIVAKGLSKRLGQQVVVENRPGATGMTAAGQVAGALPDGYTLLAIPAHSGKRRSVPQASLPPCGGPSTISVTVEFPYVWVTHTDHPIRRIADLVSAARSRSQRDPVTYGTSGVGSLQHLSVEHFASMANVKLQHIPYRGGAPAITELLGKRIDFVVDPPAALIEFIRAGGYAR